MRHPRILILDEATSALDVATRRRLFRILKRYTAGGTGVIFISHRMDEIEEIGDRITVMRSGSSVGTSARGVASPGDLFRLMTGSDHLPGVENRPSRSATRGKVVLAARGLRVRPTSDGVNFELHEGELVGVAGLEGHGQEMFLDALRGDTAASPVFVQSERGDVRVKSPAHAAANGIAYVPRDRRSDALFESRSILDNFTLPTLRRDSMAGLVSVRRSKRRWGRYVDLLKVRYGRSNDAVGTLSGGNQQKVVIARWLASEPRILLLNDPTRGVDIGIRDLYQLLKELTSREVAIVMVSSEVEEHVELMDRVLVFHEFNLSAELRGSAFTRDQLVSAFFGGMRQTDA